MEAARLNGPPDWLENMVLLAIPPAAREGVAGDLWETYQNPKAYAAEALHTVPFVIASQMRRNLNLPALMLQGALIFICVGGAATLVGLPLLMLREAYQATARPCPRRAIREVTLLSSCTMVLLFVIMSQRIHFPFRAGVEHFLWLNLFLLGLLLSPLLCIFRAVLILQGDRNTPLAASLPREELARDFRHFLHRSLRRNLLEATALAIAAACGFYFAWNVALTGLFGLAAVYLLAAAAGRAAPACDFVSLRAQYQQELARQQQLRRFLRWLWFSPVLVALHIQLAALSWTPGRAVTAGLNCVAGVVLCFLVTALNREHGGRTQEQIGSLDRMRERISPA